MYIYYCDKCQSFESFVGAEEEWKCKNCGSELIPLGVTIDEWNAMTNDQMLDTIDFAKAEFDKKNAKYEYPEVMDEPKQPKPDVRVNLMECPECFKSISPKSMRCPYCEHYFVNNPKAVRRRKAKRKTSIKVLLIGLLPAIIGAVYEGIILSGKVLEGELTLLKATGSSLLHLVLYGGFAFVLIGLIMIIVGIIGIVTNKPYLAEKLRQDDWEEGVIVSGVVTRDGEESNDAYKDVIRPVEKKKKAPNTENVKKKVEKSEDKADVSVEKKLGTKNQLDEDGLEDILAEEGSFAEEEVSDAQDNMQEAAGEGTYLEDTAETEAYLETTRESAELATAEMTSVISTETADESEITAAEEKEAVAESASNDEGKEISESEAEYETKDEAVGAAAEEQQGENEERLTEEAEIEAVETEEATPEINENADIKSGEDNVDVANENADSNEASEDLIIADNEEANNNDM